MTSGTAMYPDEWRFMSLSEAEVDVFDCEHKTPKAADVGIPYITIPQMKGGRVEPQGARLVAPEDVPVWNRRVTPESGDVILSRRTNPGATAVVPPNQPCVLGQNLVILRSKGTSIDQRYLRWLARSPEWWAEIRTYINVGAVFDSLRVADIPKFRLPVPPETEQRAIAHVLGTLDNKIELNRRVNETLEAMARALFNSWFVDFDPVRAKMDGRWQKGESLPGLPAELYDLFPDRLVGSELGEVPDGWKVYKLSDIAKQKRDSLKPEEIASGTPYIGLGDMPERSISLNGWSDGGDVGSNKYRFDAGDILFGKLRPYFHKVGIAPLDGVCSTDIVVLQPIKDSYWAITLGCASSDDFVAHTVAGATGTRMPRTSWKYMSRYEIWLPPQPDGLAARFQEVIMPVGDRIVSGIHESRILARLRDTLLPKLISGELRVPDAEQIVERAPDA